METATKTQLAALVETSALLSSTLEPAEIRRRAIEACTRVVDAERASLLVADRKGRLYFEVALGDDGTLNEVRIDPGQGIAGCVLQSREAEIVNDVAGDERYLSSIDERTGFRTRNTLCVPVTTKGETLGVVQVVNKIGGDFDAQDLVVVGALANQIAVAMENARLYQRLRRAYIESVVYAALFSIVFVAAGVWLLSLSV